MTPEHLANLKSLSDRLQYLTDNPYPDNKAWQLKLKIIIKSLQGFIDTEV